MKIKRIEHMAYILDGKRYIEGKIKLDLKEAKKENQELDAYIYKNYDLLGEDYDLREAMFETLF